MSKSIGINVVKLLSSRIAGQVVTFVTAPIIARLFSPEHFGVRQIFSSIAGVIVVITCLRYELSIPLGKNEKEASASFILSLFFTLIFTLVVLLLVVVLKGKIAQLFNMPELKTFLWLIPISVFIGGLGNSLRYWVARERRFGAMAWSSFGQSFSDRFITIAWGLILGASVTGLFVGLFSGICISLLLLLIFFGRELVFNVKNANLSFETLWTVMKHHKKFPVFNTWSVLLNTISVQLPSIILGLYFSKTVVGYYSLGYALIGLPMGLLGLSIAQVFFPAAAQEYNETGTLSQIVSNMFKKLVQLGVFPVVVLGLFGSKLFQIVFGAQWLEAGVYTQILAFWHVFTFISSPLDVYTILNRQGTGFFINVLVILGRVLGLLIGVAIGTPKVTLSIFTGFSVLIIIVNLIWKLRLSDVSVLWASKIILKYIALSCIILFPVMFISLIVKYSKAIFVTTISFIVILLRIDPSFRQFITILGKFKKSKTVCS